MKLSRDNANKIRYIIDNWLPKSLRNSRRFMMVPFKALFKDKYSLFMDFKERAPKMSDDEFKQANQDSIELLMERETDLNQDCVKRILSEITGNKILEVGCGKGYLTKKLASKGLDITGLDLSIDQVGESKGIKLVQGEIEKLPFKDNEFDTVICTHTIEHIRDPKKALSELRRVCSKRLIIVVPMQKYFKYTFDLHLQFFPDLNSFTELTGKEKEFKIYNLGGDIYYQEEE